MGGGERAPDVGEEAEDVEEGFHKITNSADGGSGIIDERPPPCGHI